MPSTIAPLERAHVPHATDALVAAFMDDPAYLEVFPDKRRREAAFRAMWPPLLRYGMRFGAVWQAEGGAAVACLLAPGNTFATAWRSLRFGLVGFVMRLPKQSRRHFMDVMEHLEQLHKRLMPEPHWYLWVLGVDPDHQREGLGSALMARALEQAADDGVPVYLEAVTEENRRFYERLGFETLASGTVPGRSFPYWAMVWRPGATRPEGD